MVELTLLTVIIDYLIAPLVWCRPYGSLHYRGRVFANPRPFRFVDEESRPLDSSKMTSNFLFGILGVTRSSGPWNEGADLGELERNLERDRIGVEEVSVSVS